MPAVQRTSVRFGSRMLPRRVATTPLNGGEWRASGFSTRCHRYKTVRSDGSTKHVESMRKPHRTGLPDSRWGASQVVLSRRCSINTSVQQSQLREHSATPARLEYTPSNTRPASTDRPPQRGRDRWGPSRGSPEGPTERPPDRREGSEMRSGAVRNLPFVRSNPDPSQTGGRAPNTEVGR